jgi:hypothetical protein
MTRSLTPSGPRTRGRARAGEADRAQAHDRGGPRTPAGKARVARNPFRHGLNLSVLADPASAAEVAALTRQITQSPDADIGELARAVAQAQVDLVRVSRARNDLLAAALSNLAGGAEEVVAERGARAAAFHVSHPDGAHRDGSHLQVPDLATRLAAMDRYERRALSRRKFAIRAFIAAGQPADPQRRWPT